MIFLINPRNHLLTGVDEDNEEFKPIVLNIASADYAHLVMFTHFINSEELAPKIRAIYDSKIFEEARQISRASFQTHLPTHPHLLSINISDVTCYILKNDDKLQLLS